MEYPEFPPQVWRYIPPLELTGAEQMAIDNWLFQEYQEHRQPPTLRFYSWSPTAISLGYHQKEYPQAWKNLTWQGHPLDIIRRSTGGRAVLHQGDLTYLVITSQKQGKKWEVYQSLCEFLIQGWRSLGIELRYGKGDRPYINHNNCFSSATDADLITPQGHKLIGSAQKRRGKAILQHGSMILNADQNLYQKVFEQTAPPPITIPLNTIIESLKTAAQKCFDIELLTQPLSASEWEISFSGFAQTVDHTKSQKG